MRKESECPLGMGLCLSTVEGRATVVRRADLIEKLQIQAAEAKSIGDSMREQGDMPEDAAFQDGVWNAMQRIIRILEE